MTMAETSPEAEFIVSGLHHLSPGVNEPPDVLLNTPDGKSTVHFQSHCPGPMLPYLSRATPSQKREATNEMQKIIKIGWK